MAERSTTYPSKQQLGAAVQVNSGAGPAAMMGPSALLVRSSASKEALLEAVPG